MLNCQPPKQKPCYVCGRFGHSARVCPNALCFRCHQPGHFARNCPTPYGRLNTGKLCLICGVEGGHDRESSTSFISKGNKEDRTTQSCPLGWPSDDVRQVICFVCQKKGHYSCAHTSQCNLNVTEPSTSASKSMLYSTKISNRSKLSCYLCGKDGHLGENCTFRAPSAAPSMSFQGKSYSLKCFSCGGVGHFARDCPKAGASRGGQYAHHQRFDSFNGLKHPRQTQQMAFSNRLEYNATRQSSFGRHVVQKPFPQQNQQQAQQNGFGYITNPNYRNGGKRQKREDDNKTYGRKVWF